MGTGPELDLRLSANRAYLFNDKCATRPYLCHESPLFLCPWQTKEIKGFTHSKHVLSKARLRARLLTWTIHFDNQLQARVLALVHQCIADGDMQSQGLPGLQPQGLLLPCPVTSHPAMSEICEGFTPRLEQANA